jgi:insulysin
MPHDSLSANLGAGTPNIRVQKSDNDARSYDFTVLDNGLQVLVVSDPVATKAAAAVDVRVGHYSDPEDLPGLAHLTEHMLFLGTTKYPDEDAFGKFLSTNGGDSNAYTDSESTNYHFFVDSSRDDVVKHALDMFSGFFAAPLLLKNSIEHEKNAVISEHAKNVDQDTWRVEQLLRSTSNPKYPYHKFGTGNAESLKDRCRAIPKMNGASTAADKYNQSTPLSKSTDTNIKPTSFLRLSSVKLALPLSDRDNNSSRGDSIDSSDSSDNSDSSGSSTPIPLLPSQPTTTPPTSECNDLHSSLVRFHKQYYSANLMRLVIVGPQSTEQLAEWAAVYFGNIPNNHRETPAVSFGYPQNSVRLPSQLGMRYNVVPVSDLRQLRLSWYMPSQLKAYRAKVMSYLATVLGDESGGSIRSTLHSEGLVNNLMAGTSEENTDFLIFSLTLDLTTDGEKRIKYVVTIIHDYLKMLRELGPQKWYWDESRSLAKVDLRFQEKGSPEDDASSLAHEMQTYSAEDVVVADYLWEEWSPEAVEAALAEMTPANMVMLCISKDFTTTKIEPIYGTKYDVMAIHPDNMVAWTKGTGGSAAGRTLRFPRTNTWIPNNFATLSGLNPAVQAEITSTKPETYPELIVQELGSTTSDQPSAKASEKASEKDDKTKAKSLEVWYKLDDTFGVPKANLMVEMHTERTLTTLREQILIELLAEVISDAVREPLYSASQSGLGYSITTDSRYLLRMEITGYSQHLRRFFGEVVNRTLNVIENEESVKTYETRFSYLYDAYIRSLKDWSNEEPYKHAMAYTTATLEDPVFLSSEMIHELMSKPATLKEVLDAGKRGLRGTCGIRSLVHGNIGKEEAKSMASIEMPMLSRKCSGPNKDANDEKKRKKLPTSIMGQPLKLHLKEPSLSNVNSCAILHCQFAFEEEWGNMHDAVVLKLVKQMTEDPAYNQLRTKENLGYDVFTLSERIHAALSTMIIVQSDTHDAEFLASRIDAFVVSHLKLLASTTKEEFQGYFDNLLSKLKSPYNSMSSESSFYWGEIVTRQLMFDRIAREIGQLHEITVQDIVNAWETGMIGAKTRRCLSVMVETQRVPSKALNKEEDIKKIRNELSEWAQPPMPPSQNTQ